MADNNNIPISVDYTNRDYYSLKNDLSTRIRTRLALADKTWAGNDPADFGVAMVEAFAYVGDMVSYYIDRVANENNIVTATQRSSILNIAREYGYVPAGFRQAYTVLEISNPPGVDGLTSADLVVPAGTQLVVSIVSTINLVQYVTQLTFTTTEDVAVPGAADGVAGVATVGAVHGEDISQRVANQADPLDINDIAGESLGVSDGTANQKFSLSSNTVIEETIAVYVRNGDYYSLWSAVNHMADWGPASTVYTIYTDENNVVSIQFGDGISGAIPTINEEIKVTYLSGGGMVGNIDSGQVFTIESVPANSGVVLSDLAGLSVTNTTKGIGGEEPETNDSIRRSAPQALRAMNRAVTLTDFSDLALSVAGVGKAKAYADNPNSVALYMGPQVSDNSQDYYPGFDPSNITTTNSWESLKTAVAAQLSDKIQIGTSLTVLPPIYTDVSVAVEFTALPDFDVKVLEQAIRSTIVYNFGYNYIEFSDVMYPSDLERRLALINGVRSVKVLSFFRTSEVTPTLGTLKPAMGELFVFTNTNLNVYQTGGLKNLETNHGTLSPSFSSSLFDYTISDSSSSTITVTPTAASGTTTITVNGTAVTSGSASTSISTPSAATTTILVETTSGDGTVTHTYTIGVIR